MAEETPHLIHKVALDPLTGPMPYQGRELAFKLGLEGKLVQQFTKIFMGTATIFWARPCAYRNQPAGYYQTGRSDLPRRQTGR